MRTTEALIENSWVLFGGIQGGCSHARLERLNPRIHIQFSCKRETCIDSMGLEQITIATNMMLGLATKQQRGTPKFSKD